MECPEKNLAFCRFLQANDDVIAIWLQRTVILIKHFVQVEIWKLNSFAPVIEYNKATLYNKIVRVIAKLYKTVQFSDIYI